MSNKNISKIIKYIKKIKGYVHFANRKLRLMQKWQNTCLSDTTAIIIALKGLMLLLIIIMKLMITWNLMWLQFATIVVSMLRAAPWVFPIWFQIMRQWSWMNMRTSVKTWTKKKKYVLLLMNWNGVQRCYTYLTIIT